MKIDLAAFVLRDSVTKLLAATQTAEDFQCNMDATQVEKMAALVAKNSKVLSDLIRAKNAKVLADSTHKCIFCDQPVRNGQGREMGFAEEVAYAHVKCHKAQCEEI